MTTPDPSRQQAITPQHITALLDGHDFKVTGHPFEVTVTNPRQPESGTIHIATDDGYVSYEPSTWQYWGILEGHQSPGSDEATIPLSRIVAALTQPPSPFTTNPPGI